MGWYRHRAKRILFRLSPDHVHVDGGSRCADKFALDFSWISTRNFPLGKLIHISPSALQPLCCVAFHAVNYRQFVFPVAAASIWNVFWGLVIMVDTYLCTFLTLPHSLFCSSDQLPALGYWLIDCMLSTCYTHVRLLCSGTIHTAAVTVRCTTETITSVAVASWWAKSTAAAPDVAARQLTTTRLRSAAVASSGRGPTEATPTAARRPSTTIGNQSAAATAQWGIVSTGATRPAAEQTCTITRRTCAARTPSCISCTASTRDAAATLSSTESTTRVAEARRPIIDRFIAVVRAWCATVLSARIPVAAERWCTTDARASAAEVCCTARTATLALCTVAGVKRTPTRKRSAVTTARESSRPPVFNDCFFRTLFTTLKLSFAQVSNHCWV